MDAASRSCVDIRAIRFLAILCAGSLAMTILFAALWRQQGFDMIVVLQARKIPYEIIFLQIVSDIKSFFCLGIPIALLLLGVIRRSPRIREKAALVIAAVLLAGLFSFAVKRIVREPRPFEVDTRIAQYSGGGGYGFPSGHTLEAVASAAMLCVLWPSATSILCAASFCFLIMLSRVYLGVHDPAEVAGGFFFGTVCALITCVGYNRSIRSLPAFNVKKTTA